MDRMIPDVFRCGILSKIMFYPVGRGFSMNPPTLSDGWPRLRFKFKDSFRDANAQYVDATTHSSGARLDYIFLERSAVRWSVRVRRELVELGIVTRFRSSRKISFTVDTPCTGNRRIHIVIYNILLYYIGYHETAWNLGSDRFELVASISVSDSIDRIRHIPVIRYSSCWWPKTKESGSEGTWMVIWTVAIYKIHQNGRNHGDYGYHIYSNEQRY